MAYTDPWLATQPVNTDAVSGADDEIRKTRLGIQERMDDVLGAVGSWATDPITQDIDKNQFIHWSAFSSTQGGSTLAVGSDFSLQSASAVTLYAPVLLPRGATITAIEIKAKSTGATAALALTLEKVDTTGAPAQTTLATITVPPLSVIGDFLLGSISLSIDATPSNFIYYYLKITWPADGTGLAGFVGVTLSYNAPFIITSI